MIKTFNHLFLLYLKRDMVEIPTTFCCIKLNSWFLDIAILEQGKDEISIDIKYREQLYDAKLSRTPIQQFLSRVLQSIKTQLEKLSIAKNGNETSISFILPWIWRPEYSRIQSMLMQELSGFRVKIIPEPLALAAQAYSKNKEKLPLVVNIDSGKVSIIKIHMQNEAIYAVENPSVGGETLAAGREDFFRDFLGSAIESNLRVVDITALAGFLDQLFIGEKMKLIYTERYSGDPKNEQFRLLTKINDAPLLLHHVLDAEEQWVETYEETFRRLSENGELDYFPVLLAGELALHSLMPEYLRNQRYPIELMQNISDVHGAVLISSGIVKLRANFNFLIQVRTNKVYFDEISDSFRIKEDLIVLDGSEVELLEYGKVNDTGASLRFSAATSTIQLSVLDKEGATERSRIDWAIELLPKYVRHSFLLRFAMLESQEIRLVLESTTDQFQVAETFKIS